MKIYELIADANRWTRCANARDAIGQEVHPNSPEACRWCLLGAMQKCYPINHQVEVWEKINRAIMGAIPNYICTTEVITSFNDDNTHADVLKVARDANV